MRPSKKRKTPLAESIHSWTLRASAYITETHCTITEAAKHFGVPRSTLWYRLECLNPEERIPTKKVAYENMVEAARRVGRRRKKK